MRVNTENEQDRKDLLNILFKMGYVWHRGTYDEMGDADRIENKYSQDEYPIVEIYPDKKDIEGDSTDAEEDIDYEWPEDSYKIFIGLIRQPLKIDNVGDYTAEIKDDGIHVGCQVISFEKFQEIADAVEAFKK